MKYYMDLAQNFGNSSKENRRIFGVNTGPDDYLPPKPAIKTLLDTSQIVKKIKNDPNKMRTNIEICKEAGLPFLEEDEIDNRRMCPDIFYKRDENGNLIPRINKCKIDSYEDNPSLFSLFNFSSFNDNLDEKNKRKVSKDNSSNYPIKSSIKKSMKKSSKNIGRKTTFNSVKKLSKEEAEFKACISYYKRIYHISHTPNELELKDIYTLGHIYFIIKYPIYVYDFENYLRFALFENEKDFIKLLKNNNKLCETYYLKENNTNFDDPSFLREFSQKIRILSESKDNSLLENSIRYFEPNGDIIMKSIKQSQSNNNNNEGDIISLNRIEKQKVTKYDLILLLLCEKTNFSPVDDGDIDNTEIYYINKGLRYEENKNDKKKKKYYFTFYFGESNYMLATVKITNNPKYSGMNDKIFEELMDSINYGEKIGMVFLYNQNHLFDIVNYSYKGKTTDVQNAFFIDCTKKNNNIWYLYELIIKYDENKNYD